ncbi:chorismate mutase [Thorsellia anophelis]|uniref:Bifunctional chorismate mutase/prephenate dehydratase n=1 Tax=Thorsellia anophelis DSM 18579 TaxID=1123402 RepID=A0A1H9YDT6_9GAMM|nr:chorismate mutase [Thorsellia anophelis]SES66618.1 chorismate mutase [Thorsellia anophelis DSM 18579]
MPNQNLINLRERITEIDEQLLTLLSKRSDIATEVAKTKLALHKPIRDEIREAELLSALIEKSNALGLDQNYIARVFRLIIEDSVQKQQKWMNQELSSTDSSASRVAFLGPKGSYSHLAARAFGHSHFDKTIECSCHRFDDIFEMVETGHAEYAVVPIENTSSGAINEVYDLLQSTSLSIVGEKIMPIEHCFMGIKPINLDEITTVYSHPQPFQQCSQFLSKYPHWKIVYCESTAAAMEMVYNEQNSSHVAIGSEAGGQIYGLNLIEKVPTNQGQNMTRFVVLHRKPKTIPLHIPTKSTFLMATGQHAGALVEALIILKNHNIVMSKLESRPMKGNPWEEMFYIDVQANLISEEFQEAITHLKSETRFFKVLGSYPVDGILF